MIHPEKERTVREREIKATGVWECAWCAGGGLSEQGSSGEGVQVDQATGDGARG